MRSCKLHKRKHLLSCQQCTICTKCASSGSCSQFVGNGYLRPKRYREQFGEDFRRLGINPANGFLTPQHFKQAIHDKKLAQDTFDIFDQNGDGSLSS